MGLLSPLPSHELSAQRRVAPYLGQARRRRVAEVAKALHLHGSTVPVRSTHSHGVNSVCGARDSRRPKSNVTSLFSEAAVARGDRGTTVSGISTSIADAVLLLGAGTLAGAVGSAGGITSLVSYPALLAVGIRPLPANVTQAVAFVANWPGSALSSRPELQGTGAWLRRWAPLIAAGGAGGVALLLCVPAGVFSRVVPFLLAFASFALLLQPRISA